MPISAPKNKKSDFHRTGTEQGWIRGIGPTSNNIVCESGGLFRQCQWMKKNFMKPNRLTHSLKQLEAKEHVRVLFV